MLRAAFLCVGLALYILVLGPPLLIFTVITRNPDPLYWTALRGVLFFVRAVGVRVKVVGTERIPAGPVIFAANHTSSADAPAVVGAIPRRIAILLKKSLFEWPIVGQAFHLARFIPVERSSRESAIGSMEKATEALKAGQSFLIYPEGTRSPDGRLQEFKKGTVVMAIKAGVPLVPVACSNAHRIMKKRELKIYPGEIRVEFLAPIDSTKFTVDQRDELNQLLHDGLAAGLPEDQRPTGFRKSES